MDKTGESYTTARRRVLASASESTGPGSAGSEPTASELTASEPTRPEPTGPELAGAEASALDPAPQSSTPAQSDTSGTSASGISGGVKAQGLADASVRERTGRGWDEWFVLLDAWGATDRTHTEIARRLMHEHQVDGWWAQSVTVAYEQARGMRAPGQRSDGSFSATASKTISVPVERLFAAFDDAELRERWLPGAGLTVRTATAPKSFRAGRADGSRIAVGFVAKGDAKAQVAVLHEKLADAEAAARMKEYWRERLTELKRLAEN
ncbi:SRPBCC family protein [Actinoallomurus bryophytorum]|nr:hypothetical protein [Actinoallomurus bryophytorum]